MRESPAARVARQLEQGARARGVVVGAGRAPDVVTMGDKGDDLLRLRHVRGRRRRRRGDQVHEVLRAETGHVGVELLALDREVVVAETSGDPVGGSLRPGCPGPAIRKVPRELCRKLNRSRPVERGREPRLLERHRLPDAEGRDEQGHGDDEPGGSVDTA